MREYLIYSFILVMASYLSPLTFATSDEELEYPDIGVLSSDRTDHFRIYSHISLAKGWLYIYNSYDYNCKRYKEKMTLGDLKSLMIFNDNDLIPMTKEMEAEYGQDSVYFESCNRLGLSPSIGQAFFDLLDGKWPRWEEPTLLDWGNSDAYIDSEHSLLLVKYLDNDETKSFDKREVSVLFIDKEDQLISNREEKAGFLGNLIGSKGF